MNLFLHFFFFFQAEDGIRDLTVTGVQTCALPILICSKRSRPCRRCSAPSPSPTACRPRRCKPSASRSPASPASRSRSEERRVGKECRARWAPDHQKKKQTGGDTKSVINM